VASNLERVGYPQVPAALYLEPWNQANVIGNRKLITPHIIITQNGVKLSKWSRRAVPQGAGSRVIDIAYTHRLTVRTGFSL
jgi:hypothetical protein